MKRAISLLLLALVILPLVDLALDSEAGATKLMSWTAVKKLFQNVPADGGCGGGSIPPPPPPPSGLEWVWEIVRIAGSV